MSTKQKLLFRNAILVYQDTKSWMITNKLKLYDGKIECFIIGLSSTHRKFQNTHALSVGKCKISSAKPARNLGVIVDKHMNIEYKVTSICKSASYHLRNIGTIRHVITESSSIQLAHTLISSCLDYCNSLLYGIMDRQIKRRQRLQNNAARIVFKIKKYDQITPILQKLCLWHLRSSI